MPPPLRGRFALRRPAENGGALDKLVGDFVMLGIGMLMDPALREPVTSALDRLADAMNPWPFAALNHSTGPVCRGAPDVASRLDFLPQLFAKMEARARTVARGVYSDSAMISPLYGRYGLA